MQEYHAAGKDTYSARIPRCRKGHLQCKNITLQERAVTAQEYHAAGKDIYSAGIPRRRKGQLQCRNTTLQEGSNMPQEIIKETAEVN
jgi:hypothetical protein